MKRDIHETTLVNTNLPSARADTLRYVELAYRGTKCVLGKDDLPFTIGRDEESNRLIVTNELASRCHCSIDLLDDQVGLFDKSTNGTFVKHRGINSVCVRKEFFPLVGEGFIKLGERISADDADLIEFKVVMRKSLKKRVPLGKSI